MVSYKACTWKAGEQARVYFWGVSPTVPHFPSLENENDNCASYILLI